ncbi:hypothetical protein B0J11DRAFT_546596 [Dendryphion nanum]|uniref:Uncharacterized protein n=1 Tax=Dendryphion nanum TaxID=256645 RepID=A0A9P9J0N2_9PLEO|nr:hypothetical protein B0J11DRAFT_546596 [Dendryphion nanum]
MWKRLQGSREKDRTKKIGNPTLLETTYDQEHLQNIPTISHAQNATYQPNYESPGSAPYYDTLSPNDINNNEYRASEVPTVSSFYSQPSPALRSDYHYADAPQSDHDISPPSSPEPDQPRRNLGQPQRLRSMRDVSPVDDSRSRTSVAQRVGSNIPVLRKAPPSLRSDEPAGPPKKFWGGKVAPNSKVRWDEYSGEPTGSNAGKSGQVNPGSYAKGTPLSPPGSEKPRMGYRVSVTGGERANRASTKPSPVDTTLAKPRAPWKGASGRAEIVQPFKHQAATKSPNFFRKAEPSPILESPSDASNSLVATVAPADTAPVADVREQFDTHDNPIKPTVPLKVGKNSPPRSIASPVSPNYPANYNLASPTSLYSPNNNVAHSLPTPTTPTNRAYPVTNEAEIETEATRTNNSGELSTPANAKVVRKSVENTPGSNTSKDNGLGSRFSWTTYNTSTTYQHSPPASPPPPLPNGTPVLDQEPLPAASSILNRRRPVPTSDTLPIRKPIPGTTATNSRFTMASSGPSSPRPGSTFSTNTQKALPRPPTEISAADHVDILEAQIEDLRVRRSNVHRLLQDLYNAAPPNPLVTDFKRMRIVEKRKKDFEDELAEIKVEEHDVGLKLHRALRKRERADPGSESAIWIRRVTR